MRFLYPPNVRIRTKCEYDNVFKLRKRLYGRYFLAYYRNNELSHPRLGIITSKRNSRLAVNRNLVRRLIKEQFRLNKEYLPSLDIVFIAKKGIEQATNKELTKCIKYLLHQLVEKAKR